MKYSITKIHEYPLELILKQRKTSIRKFAKVAGVEYSYLSRILKEKHIATEAYLDKIVAAVDKLPPYDLNN